MRPSCRGSPRGGGPAPTSGSGPTTRPAGRGGHPPGSGAPGVRGPAARWGCTGRCPETRLHQWTTPSPRGDPTPDRPRAPPRGPPSDASARRPRPARGRPRGSSRRRQRERPGRGHVVARHAPIARGGPRDRDRRLAHPGRGHGAGRPSPMAMPPRAPAGGTRGRARTAHGPPPARRHLLHRFPRVGGPPQHGGRRCIILSHRGGTLLRRCQLSTH